MNIENYFLVDEISSDYYLIYNAIKHIPIKVNKEGLSSFYVIIGSSKNGEYDDLRYTHTQKKNFIRFKKELDEINFFSMEEESISYQSVFPKFDSTKKTFYLHLTNRCNLSYQYCFNRFQRKNTKDLDVEEWMCIIKKKLPCTKSIILTGGEAILHEEANKIVHFTENKSDTHVELFSNASIHFDEFKLGNLLFNDFKDIYYSNIATMLRASNNMNHKNKWNVCNVKYVCAGGCIANTYNLENGLLEHPKTLCSFFTKHHILVD